MTNRYFYDTEFHEQGEGLPIELISIGVVAEDGREYYAVLRDWSVSRAMEHEFLRKEVLPYLDLDVPCRNLTTAALYRDLLSLRSESPYFKSRGRVREELTEFFGEKPELWAYCSAYDHVCLTQIWGTFSDFPEGYPYYTNDLAQLMVDRKLTSEEMPKQEGKEHNALEDARWAKSAFEHIKIWEGADHERPIEG